MSELVDRELFPPGEYIRDELEARNWTQEDLAAIIGRPLKTVNQIITGKKLITTKTAQELGAAFGTSAELWLNLESAHRLALEAEDQQQVSRRARLFGMVPVNEISKRGWIPSSSSIDELESHVLSFLEVASFDDSPQIRLAARMSANYSEFTSAQIAYAMRVRHLADAVPAQPFDAARARRMLGELHALTVSPEEIRRVPKVLADMGIKLVVVEHLGGTRIDGMTTWTDRDEPVIAVSLRYDRIDGFWHTLAHEMSHVLNGDRFSIDENLIGKDKIGSEITSEVEQRADKEAAEFLIPPEKLKSFITRTYPRFSKIKIIQFANLHQIHPGIVVGQLQHSKAIKFSHSREMLVGVRAILTASALTDGWGIHPGI